MPNQSIARSLTQTVRTKTLEIDAVMREIHTQMRSLEALTAELSSAYYNQDWDAVSTVLQGLEFHLGVERTG
jgi:hypothetical protein